MSEASESVRAALDPLIQGFHADGYAVRLSEEGSTLLCEFVAQPGACADCLAPHAVIRQIFDQALRQRGLLREIQLRYPDDL